MRGGDLLYTTGGITVCITGETMHFSTYPACVDDPKVLEVVTIGDFPSEEFDVILCMAHTPPVLGSPHALGFSLDEGGLNRVDVITAVLFINLDSPDIDTIVVLSSTLSEF